MQYKFYTCLPFRPRPVTTTTVGLSKFTFDPNYDYVESDPVQEFLEEVSTIIESTRIAVVEEVSSTLKRVEFALPYVSVLDKVGSNQTVLTALIPYLVAPAQGALQTVFLQFPNETQEATREVINIVRDPLKALWGTTLGKYIIFGIVLGLALVLVRFLYAFCSGCSCAWRGFRYVCNPEEWLPRICALRPFLFIRTWMTRRENERNNQYLDSTIELEKRPIYNEEIVRTVSVMAYDDHGPYLLGPDGVRVYRVNNESMPEPVFSERINEITRKETVLAQSVARREPLPPFIGLFKVDDNVVGHFSRIRYDGCDCILTAFHVFDYNRNTNMVMARGENVVAMSGMRFRMLSVSPVLAFDYIIAQVPSEVFTKLGIKQGKIAPRMAKGEPISVPQVRKGVDITTCGVPWKHDERPWHVRYKATTYSGSSGTPLLNMRQEIVGIHLEGDPDNFCNIGVVPPAFRQRKETGHNGDIMEDEEIILEGAETPEEKEMRLALEAEHALLEEEERFERAAIYEVYAMEYEDRFQQAERRNWVEEMDDFDDYVRNKKDNRVAEFSEAKVGVMWTSKSEKTGGHIGQRVKGNRFRKESPWTCTNCGTLHHKAGFKCTICSYPLRPCLTRKEKTQGEKEVLKIVTEKANYDVAVLVEQKTKEMNDRLSSLEVILKRALESKPVPSIYPPLPKDVSMTKTMATKLNTLPVTKESSADLLGFQSTIRVEEGELVDRKLNMIDTKKSEKEGCIVLKNNPNPLGVKVEAKKPKRMAPVKMKETSVPDSILVEEVRPSAPPLPLDWPKLLTDEEAGTQLMAAGSYFDGLMKGGFDVDCERFYTHWAAGVGQGLTNGGLISYVKNSLNSRAPLGGGAACTPGTSQDKSIAHTCGKSETVNVNSTQPALKKSRKRGNKQKSSDLPVKSTAGPTGAH